MPCDCVQVIDWSYFLVPGRHLNIHLMLLQLNVNGRLEQRTKQICKNGYNLSPEELMRMWQCSPMTHLNLRLEMRTFVSLKRFVTYCMLAKVKATEDPTGCLPRYDYSTVLRVRDINVSDHQPGLSQNVRLAHVVSLCVLQSRRATTPVPLLSAFFGFLLISINGAWSLSTEKWHC